MLERITPLVLTYDEGPNLARCLERLSWAHRVVIVDSLSTDETPSVAARFRNVSMHQREFDSHAAQWNFGLDLVDTEWVLSLDADYMLTEEFVAALRQLRPAADVDAFYAAFRYWIGGKPLRASLYPPRAVLFRKDRCRYVQDGHTQVLRVPGRTGRLPEAIDHDDRKSLTRWVWAQDRYARLEAAALLSADPRALPRQDKLRRLMIVAPVATLLHTLFVRRVILDGWRGWFYALQRTSAELLLSLRLLEARMGEPRRPALGATAASRIDPRQSETLFLLTEAFRAPGGIQRYNRDQVAAMRRCDPAGRLRLFSLNDHPQDVLHPEWAGLHARGFARNKVRFVVQSTWAALVHRPGRVMFGHRNFLVLAPLLHLAAPTAPRWLLSYGIDVGPRFNRLERAFLRHVDRVFAISPQTATAVRQAGWNGPVDLWPCSLPFSWSLPAVAPPRFERPLRLLLVSRLYDRYKGIGHALDALRLLLERGIEARLDVVGEGPDRTLLEGRAGREGVSRSVRFHGRLDTPALQQLYEACDVFVLPSCSEGFGIVYLEAMAYGKPVVGAEAGATPFVVRPGVSGFLVPYGDPERLADCIAALAERPDEARRVGLSARVFLEETFSFERMVERTRAILNAPEPDAGG